jgi:branched-chain amino acid transport system ATP-binding protein
LEAVSKDILNLSGVSRSFGGLKAIDDMNLSVGEGVIFGLIGPNGAGKTTLINLMSGLDSPNLGSITIGGVDLTGKMAHHFARSGVARTFQNMKLFKGMTVLEHVIVGLDTERKSKFWQMIIPVPSERKERKEVSAKAMQILERLDMAHAADRIADTLPYGSQRRLEIARAIATNPKILLLDEPTAGMNAIESAEIGALLTLLRKDGLSILVVEHNIAFVRQFCDRIAVMNFGQKIAEGLPVETLDLPIVREAYLGASGAERLHRLRSGRNRV